MKGEETCQQFLVQNYKTKTLKQNQNQTINTDDGNPDN